MNKKKLLKYAAVIRQVAHEHGDERSSKCGYDLMMGLVNGNAEDRFRAWKGWLENGGAGARTSTTEQRDGCWVPAVPLRVPSCLELILESFK